MFPNTTIAAPSEPPEGRGGPGSSQAHKAAAAGPTYRVVFAEDDYLTALSNIDSLENEGYDVVAVVQTGGDAIEVVSDEQPDLVVMDIRLNGGLDGVDAAIEIFRRFGIRSVFATAHTDAKTRARAAEAKPLAWVAKPYSDKQLIQALNKACAELD